MKTDRSSSDAHPRSAPAGVQLQRDPLRSSQRQSAPPWKETTPRTFQRRLGPGSTPCTTRMESYYTSRLEHVFTEEFLRRCGLSDGEIFHALGALHP